MDPRRSSMAPALPIHLWWPPARAGSMPHARAATVPTPDLREEGSRCAAARAVKATDRSCRLYMLSWPPACITADRSRGLNAPSRPPTGRCDRGRLHAPSACASAACLRSLHTPSLEGRSVWRRQRMEGRIAWWWRLEERIAWWWRLDGKPSAN